MRKWAVKIRTIFVLNSIGNTNGEPHFSEGRRLGSLLFIRTLSLYGQRVFVYIVDIKILICFIWYRCERN